MRRLNPDAVYCCDPVMGDVGRGMFVLPGVPELIREQVVPRADIVTPNLFELQYLATGLGARRSSPTRPRSPDAAGTLDALLEAVHAGARGRAAHRAGHVGGGGVVGADGEIGMLAVDDTGAYLVRTPLLPVAVNGAGDVTAALFLAHLPDGIEVALARVASSVYAILDATARAGSREIRLVQAQSAIAEPACEFGVLRLA